MQINFNTNNKAPSVPGKLAGSLYVFEIKLKKIQNAKKNAMLPSLMDN